MHDGRARRRKPGGLRNTAYKVDPSDFGVGKQYAFAEHATANGEKDYAAPIQFCRECQRRMPEKHCAFRRIGCCRFMLRR